MWLQVIFKEAIVTAAFATQGRRALWRSAVIQEQPSAGCADGWASFLSGYRARRKASSTCPGPTSLQGLTSGTEGPLRAP